MIKLLVRLKLRGSNIKFVADLPTGVLSVAQIVLEEEPESLDETLQSVKMNMLHSLFDIEYVQTEEPLINMQTTSIYPQ